MELIEIPAAEYAQLVMQNSRLERRIAGERAKNDQLRAENDDLTAVLTDYADRLAAAAVTA